jgi:hypothetical protein
VPIGRKTDEERSAEIARKQAEAQRRAAEWEATRMTNEQEAARRRYWASAVGQADAPVSMAPGFFRSRLKNPKSRATPLIRQL